MKDSNTSTGPVFGEQVTAFARMLCQSIRDNFEDGQIEVDLRGLSEAPASSEEVMMHVLASTSHTSKIESSIQLRSMYYSRLSNKKLLLLMENLGTDETLSETLPPSGCITIITSRTQFVCPGMIAINLGVLPEEDAEKMVLSICPRTGSYASTIASKFGCLPLAVRISASTLASRPDLDVAAYIGMIDKKGRLHDIVKKSLDLSFKFLPKDIANKFVSLAVFPGAFSPSAVAYLWKTTIEEASFDLSELKRFGLIDWQDHPVGYRLHDLTKLYTEFKIDTESLMDFRIRYSFYYLQYLAWLGSQSKKGLNDLKVALLSLQWNLHNFEQALMLADSYAANKPEMHYVASHIASCCPQILRLRLSPQDALRWHQIEVKNARFGNDRTNLAIAIGNLGTACADLDLWVEAKAHYEEYLSLSIELGIDEFKMFAYGRLATVHEHFGAFDQALTELNNAVSIAPRTISPSKLVNIKKSIGRIHNYQGHGEEALEYFQDVLKIAKNIKDKQLEANVLNDIAATHARLGNLSYSSDLIAESYEIASILDDKSQKASALCNMGFLLAHSNDSEGAIEPLTAALVLAEELGDQRMISNVFRDLGVAFGGCDRRASALESINKGNELSRLIHDALGEAEGLWTLALIHRKWGETEIAINNAEAALAVFIPMRHRLVAQVTAFIEAAKEKLSISVE